VEAGREGAVSPLLYVYTEEEEEEEGKMGEKELVVVVAEESVGGSQGVKEVVAGAYCHAGVKEAAAVALYTYPGSSVPGGRGRRSVVEVRVRVCGAAVEAEAAAVEAPRAVASARVRDAMREEG